MSKSPLPERASLEYLKKLAKDRLKGLRRKDPNAKLAAAQLGIAREHGFSSWRALKQEMDRRKAGAPAAFLDACSRGDLEAVREWLARDKGLVSGHKNGWTGLHEASRRGHLACVRLLLQSGADPNARESGDHTTPLHWAAAHGHLEIVRALLDAGSDVHGFGDVHQLDAIGWASEHPQVIALLIDRGARHHVFSAIASGDLEALRALVRDNPRTLDRRMSRFEFDQTPLHFAISRKRYDMLDLLIELGADLDAEDATGHTALATAMMRGDHEAVRRLTAAGAKSNKGWSIPDAKSKTSGDFKSAVAKLAESARKVIPMIRVRDIPRALDWYASLGFTEVGRVEDNWGMVAFGGAELMFMQGEPGKDSVRLWFYTAKIEELYQLFKARQIEIARATLRGATVDGQSLEFVEDLHDPPYGGREFSIRDLDGYTVLFRRG